MGEFQSAFVMIVCAGRVLIVKRRKKSLWGLPGGGIDEGESPLAAAIRETREEAQLVLNQAELSPHTNYRTAHVQEVDRKAIVVFRAEFKTQRMPVLNEEHTDYAWLPLADAVRLELHHSAHYAIQTEREELLAIASRTSFVKLRRRR